MYIVYARIDVNVPNRSSSYNTVSHGRRGGTRAYFLLYRNRLQNLRPWEPIDLHNARARAA